MRQSNGGVEQVKKTMEMVLIIFLGLLVGHFLGVYSRSLGSKAHGHPCVDGEYKVESCQ